MLHSNEKYDFLGLIQFFSYNSFYQLVVGRPVKARTCQATTTTNEFYSAMITFIVEGYLLSYDLFQSID